MHKNVLHIWITCTYARDNQSILLPLENVLLLLYRGVKSQRVQGKCWNGFCILKSNKNGVTFSSVPTLKLFSLWTDRSSVSQHKSWSDRPDRVKEADRKEREVENNNSRTKTHSDKKWHKSLAHPFTHSQKKNKHNLSIFMNADTNSLRLHFTNTTKNCKFLTTPIRWDFTDQTAGFQLASHNYVPRLPLHPLPPLSPHALPLPLFTLSRTEYGCSFKGWRERLRETNEEREGKKNQWQISWERERERENEKWEWRYKQTVGRVGIMLEKEEKICEIQVNGYNLFGGWIAGMLGGRKIALSDFEFNTQHVSLSYSHPQTHWVQSVHICTTIYRRHSLESD